MLRWLVDGGETEEQYRGRGRVRGRGGDVVEVYLAHVKAWERWWSATSSCASS